MDERGRTDVNQAHLDFLASPDWARMLETDLLPWILQVTDLGDDVLEVGPGPGLTTDLLRTRTARLTADELDEQLATALAERLAGTNVDVVHGDATDTGFASDRFTTATCFSMLHHVPSAGEQDRVFAELHRVLRPAGALVGVDSLDHEVIRSFHVDDVFVPLDADALPARLERFGFTDVHLDVGEFEVRFRAVKQ
jgi:SAM-dependent methyltransferase